jgi:hypothetical protein
MDNTAAKPAARAEHGNPNLHHHPETLRRRGLLVTIGRTVDRDAELHPLVRWQFVGGLNEEERRALLFTSVVDGAAALLPFPSWSEPSRRRAAPSTQPAWLSAERRRKGVRPETRFRPDFNESGGEKE